ncbi:MAG TPA: ABC transporter permease [Planctomicrobium sp.]|nr:ABC transporter permease [Planctomicrobium sp.]
MATTPPYLLLYRLNLSEIPLSTTMAVAMNQDATDHQTSPTISSGDDVWTLVITPHRPLLEIPLRELWEYRDLLWMLVQREIVTAYKQTILGPIWYLLQPLMTMLVFIVVFGNIAQIPTDGLPPALFYLAGIVMWNYFAEAFSRTSTTFTMNADLFGKVYFPRLVVPLALVVSGLLKFLVQLSLFLIIFTYFLLSTDRLHPNLWILTIPFLVLMMAALGLGFGVIFSSMTTKYRDLTFVIQFGVQLLMYATPIIYPMSLLSPRLKQILWWNPIAHLIETFRFAFLGEGEVSLLGLSYSAGFAIIVLITGMMIFNHTERSFMDTV